MRRAIICGALAVCLGLLHTAPLEAAPSWHRARATPGVEQARGLLEGLFARIEAFLGAAGRERRRATPRLEPKTGCHLDPLGCPPQ